MIYSSKVFLETSLTNLPKFLRDSTIDTSYLNALPLAIFCKSLIRLHKLFLKLIAIIPSLSIVAFVIKKFVQIFIENRVCIGIG